MGKLKEEIVTPIPENQLVYDKLYAEYRLLYDYFGRGSNDVMKRLKAIRHDALIVTHFAPSRNRRIYCQKAYKAILLDLGCARSFTPTQIAECRKSSQC